MGIKNKAEEKILDVAYDLRARSQAQFVNWTASEEGWDFETAWAVCHGEHATIVRPDLTLGFKLADPILQTSFNMARKKNRAAAREKFREELSPAERELFDGIDHDESAKKFKGELKKKKKKGEGLRGEKQTKPLGVGFLSPLHGAFSTSTFQYKVLQTDRITK